ncbi:MAG: excinuclease ABC subunit UvrC, partial [Thermoanaerobaculia bacterium]|nr:excinuclease ABC subunit UvrC [Thermoanaerobaculia bacterium]
MDERILERLEDLPDRPGIYVFRDAVGEPLYVGKAKSLRKRVPSYQRTPGDPRLRTMLAEATDLEYVVTDTEAEALLLENNWIKNHRPRYNILLRDDKTYPYLKLTTQEEWPRLAFTRRVRDDGATYFGPYLPGGLARKAIKLVQKLFQIRVCRIPIDGSLPRPCLYHPMDRCLGPCVDGLTSKEEYDRAVEEASLFLSGRTEEVSRRMKSQMQEASEALEFERAARLRDTIRAVEEVSQRQKLASTRGEDVDVYGHHLAGGNAAVVILVMRGGQVLDRRELFWEGEADVEPARLLSEVLPQLYERTTFIPREIHLPLPIESPKTFEEWLSDRKGSRVYLRFPSRGPKARRVE